MRARDRSTPTASLSTPTSTRSTRAPSDRAALPAPRARRVRCLARHQHAGEGGGMRAVLGEERFQTLERTLAPCEPDAVDGEIVDQARVEIVLRVAGARLRHPGWWLLGNPALGVDGLYETGE